MKKILRSLFICFVCIALLCSSCAAEATTPTIGIAWRADTDSEFLTNVTAVLDALDCPWRLLDQVISYDVQNSGALNDDGYMDRSLAEMIQANTYSNSNAADVMKDVDAVIFTGGEDIAPTLYGYEAGWHGIEDEWDYNLDRDISDYILMSYCLDNDMPVLGLCRGMQMLGVISGTSAIQDIPTFFDTLRVEYGYQHRNQKATSDSYRDYAAHVVTIEDSDSLVFQIYGTELLEGCPSWHHQALLSVIGTPLKVSGYTMTGGIAMIEAIERTDKTFAVGLQFHPEAAAVKHLNDAANADDFMSLDTALLVFERLIDAAK